MVKRNALGGNHLRYNAFVHKQEKLVPMQVAVQMHKLVLQKTNHF